MKKLVVLVLLLGLFGCGESEEERMRKQERAIEHQIAIERKDEADYPMNYLEFIAYKHEMNFWGTKSLFEAVIRSNAKYVKYEDVVIKIEWLTNQDKVIEEWGYLHKATYEPSQTHKVKFEKGAPPEYGEKYRLSVVSAKYELLY